MLQIISGKFFRSEDLFVTPKVGVFYSNINIEKSIDTLVCSVKYIETIDGISKYELHYDNKIEKISTLVCVGDNEILKQFIAIFSFYFQVYASISRAKVEEFCNAEEIPSMGYSVSIMKKGLNSSDEKIIAFESFVEKLIGAERKDYSNLIQCFYTFLNSIEYAKNDIDLSYSLLIYFLESLTQQYDDYQAVWNDYNQNQKRKWEDIFASLDNETSEKIKSVLLNDNHLKLQMRFLHFISSNISDNFFLEEAEKIEFPLRKSHIKQVLINAYNIRSKYTHLLKGMNKELKFDSLIIGDTITQDNDIYITYNGLLRLCHHTTMNFIKNLNQVEKQDFNWYDEIPNLVTLPLADEYWLHKTENFNSKQANTRFNGILRVLQHSILTNSMKVNLLSLLKVYEKQLPQANLSSKISMLSGYIIYNTVIDEESILLALPNYNKIISQYKNVLKNKTPETLILKVFTDKIDEHWSLEEIVDTYTSYENKRYKLNAISYPRYFDLLICIVIACEYLELDKGKYFEWMTKAILDIPGDLKLQKYLLDKRNNYELVDIQMLIVNKFSIDS